MASHDVTGGGRTTIHVDETGDDDGPAVLFVHGCTQSRLAWDRQLQSDLDDDFRLVAMDLRGHGDSERPTEAYDDPALWGDDVRAVIDELQLDQPTLVGWSYGGLVMSDYFKTHGCRSICSSVRTMGPPWVREV
ncbi:alpha/beta fold hydrolase [Halomarina ordinaria]|uniref:Alpha/beta fold hydrolase n=1 Tax=Halomarina ordinaria TaxID=3033939 RepID=A0ABD5UI72_9EURY|nr:alpha/beta hydrolase [Halomarina sp. PSRA2]